MFVLWHRVIVFLKSARDAERFAININPLGQMVPEKSKE